MRKRKKLLVVIASTLILFGMVIIWFIIFAPKENAADVERHYSASILVSSRGVDSSDKSKKNQKSDFYDELNWYDSFEEAVQDGSKAEDQRYKDYIFNKEFLRLEFNEKLIIFFTIPNSGNIESELIGYVVFAHDKEKFSQPYLTRGCLPVPGWGDRGFYFECDAAVVDYITLELFSHRVLNTHGLQMFFGSWPNKEELESLTLAGMNLEILDEPVVINGEEYYFWYLTDTSWLDRLSEISWSTFTYRQIIEALDIQYEPMELEADI